MRASTVVIALLLFAACGASTIPQPSDESIARAQTEWPESDRASLAHGRQLYIARCSGCHPLHAPSAYPAARWNEALAEMAPRARLTAEETELVRRYLLTMAADEPAAAH